MQETLGLLGLSNQGAADYFPRADTSTPISGTMTPSRQWEVALGICAIIT